jgi:predicted kinase
VLFDAMEFNESFASIDIFFDLAFLLMDFERRGMPEFATTVLSRALAQTRDIEALAALPLFLSLRAAIRAFNVAAMGQAGDARDYFDRARTYLTPVPPRLLAVGGLQGTGKSNLSRRLAPLVGARPGALVLRSDVARKVLMGVPPETRLPETAYTEAITREVYRGMLKDAEMAIAAGHSVILDAVFARPEQRDSVAELAANLDVPFDGFWLEADAETLRHRVETRKNNASDATVAVLDRQMTRDPGPISWHRLDSSGSKDATLAAAQRILAHHQ